MRLNVSNLHQSRNFDEMTFLIQILSEGFSNDDFEQCENAAMIIFIQKPTCVMLS